MCVHPHLTITIIYRVPTDERQVMQSPGVGHRALPPGAALPVLHDVTAEGQSRDEGGGGGGGARRRLPGQHIGAGGGPATALRGVSTR